MITQRTLDVIVCDLCGGWLLLEVVEKGWKRTDSGNDYCPVCVTDVNARVEALPKRDEGDEGVSDG